MKSFARLFLTLAPLSGIGIFFGCAEGTEADFEELLLASTSVDAGNQQSDGTKLPASSHPPDDDKDDSGVGSGGGGLDAGVDGSVVKDDGGGGGGGGGTGACASPNTCSGATALGVISGDTGADVLNTDGSTSQWFTVRVTEDDGSPFAAPLWMTATLTSPPDTNFDLYLYVPFFDTLECSAVSFQSTSTNATDVAIASFGETGGLIPNGLDDDRTVTVEVRHISGTCDDPTKKWTLKIEGN